MLSLATLIGGRDRLGEDKTVLTAHLEEALEGTICPLCSLGQARETTYLDILLHERINDDRTREQLKESHGFCPEHTRRLLEVGGYGIHAKIALLYRRLVEGLAAEAAAAEPGRKGAPDYVVDCPACRAVAQTERIYAELLAMRLAAEVWQSKYRDSAGLCLRHYPLVLARCKGQAAAFLQRDQARRLEELAADLAEFVRKSVVKNEIFGRERDAWERVLRLCAGPLEG